MLAAWFLLLAHKLETELSYTSRQLEDDLDAAGFFFDEHNRPTIEEEYRISIMVDASNCHWFQIRDRLNRVTLATIALFK